MRAPVMGLLLMLTASEAAAGAWPREKGAAFFSLSQTMSTGTQTLLAPTLDISSYTGLYAEYGLTEKLTIGLIAGKGGDIGSGQSDSDVTSILGFARYPIWSHDSGHRVAFDLGVGTIEDTTDGLQQRIRPGLAWGYGFESRWGGGWLGIETSLDYRQPTGDTAFKADLTAGIKPNDRYMYIFQVQSGRYPNAEPLVRIAPSFVRKMSDHFHLQLGGFVGAKGDDSIGGTIAVWASF